jgi:hypothetical protein
MVSDSARGGAGVGARRISKLHAALGAAVVALVAVVGLAALQGVRLFETGAPPATQASRSQPGTAAAFANLSAQHSNYCSLSADKVMSYPDDARLQGACCSAMDMAKYQWQVDGLRPYSNIPEIPQDPYDISVAQAKQLLGYDGALTLTPDQQETYDSAMSITDDRAPCCCQCWRWYMTRGLSKFLIINHSMGASEVASIVDLVNGCGGPMEEDSTAALTEASG